MILLVNFNQYLYFLESGFWSASSYLLQIDQKSGVGVGSGSGAAIIYYSDGAFRTYAEVLYFNKIGVVLYYCWLFSVVCRFHV